MKKILIFLLLILTISQVSAISVQVEKPAYEILIPELNQPAVFDLNVTNLAGGGTFAFYNVPGFFTMESVEGVQIDYKETRKVQLKVHAKEDFQPDKFFYVVQYTIKGSDLSTQAEELTIKTLGLKDVFEVGASEVLPDSDSLKFYIKNKENFYFEAMKVKFSSNFFEVDKSFPLEPNEKKEFEIDLDNDDFNNLQAGFYTLKAEVEVEGKKADVEGVVKFTAKSEVNASQEDSGFFIHTKTISKTNKGNLIEPMEVTIEKNIISRLFTTFSPSPDSVERQGAKILYSWSKDLKPGETLDIIVKTNWLIPLIIIVLIVVIVVFGKKISVTDLVLRKKISFVRARGGEFALKVSLTVNAKKYVEKVRVIDRLPPLVKIYEKFGVEKPTRVNERAKTIEWDFEKLEAGEFRVINYIIFSRIGVLGRFALPPAIALYNKGQQIKEVVSNKAFFIAEQKRSDVEERVSED